MSNPAFIVDGFTEKLILQQICPGCRVSRTDLNGKSVSIEAIAKKIASLIRLLNNRHYPIIILIDKEERDETVGAIIEKLETNIKGNGVVNQDLRIGVADRMIENWIISDWNCLNVGAEKKPSLTEGVNGSSIIKKIKGNYGKTTDGVELFLSANPKEIYKNSESFRLFADRLEGVDCKYLK